MSIQDDLQSLKNLKPYYPTFNLHCSKLQLSLEFGLGNGEITLDQYKYFCNEIDKIKIHAPKLVYVSMYSIMKTSNVIVTYKLHCGSLEKIHEELASGTTDNEPKLNTMGIF